VRRIVRLPGATPLIQRPAFARRSFQDGSARLTTTESLLLVLDAGNATR